MLGQVTQVDVSRARKVVSEGSMRKRCLHFSQTDELGTRSPLGLFVIFSLSREAQGKGTLLWCQEQVCADMLRVTLRSRLGRGGMRCTGGVFTTQGSTVAQAS